MATTSRVAATVAAAGVLAAGAAIASSATAAADPVPPVPADPPLPSDGQPDTPGGLPIAGYLNSNELLLGQYSVPAVGGTQPSAPPDFDTMNANAIQYLFGPNLKLSEQGQESMYSVGPPDPNAPVGDKWEYFRRAHGDWHMVMGKLDPSQLGEPLPGTAPPPGTNIPVGLEQYLPEPPPAIPPVPPPSG